MVRYLLDQHCWSQALRSTTHCQVQLIGVWHFICSEDKFFQEINESLMSAMVSQITGISIVWFTVCSGADQRKRQNSALLAFVRGIHRWLVTGEFPSQLASNADNVSYWWRHHDTERVFSKSLIATAVAFCEMLFPSALIISIEIVQWVVFSIYHSLLWAFDIVGDMVHRWSF